MAMFMLGSARCSSETDRVGVIHSNHARGVQYWHSTRLGAADREEQGIGVHRLQPPPPLEPHVVWPQEEEEEEEEQADTVTSNHTL